MNISIIGISLLMKFNYQARTKAGEIQTGIVEASSKEGALNVLRAHGLIITAIEKAVVPIYAKKLKIFDRVSSRDITVFSRQVAIMFKSKVPLIEIFTTIADQTKNAGFKEKILKISEEVKGGSSLSAAFSLFPNIFSPFYISMVKSGEASGKLTDIFLYLAKYLENDDQFRGKIKGAMIYPAFIAVVFFGVLYLIVSFVIPSLSAFLTENNGGELPWITRVVIDFSDFINTKGWIIAVIAFLVGGGLYYFFFRTTEGRRIYNETVLRIPMLNSLLKKLYLTRFAMNLSTLISGGIPIVQSLEITADVVGNDTYKNIILKTRDEVKKGEKLSTVLKEFPNYISPMFYQMIIVGEKTGTLDSSLTNVVDFYQREIDSAIEQFLKLLEPIIIIFFGVIVAGLIAAVLLPLYSSMGSL